MNCSRTHPHHPAWLSLLGQAGGGAQQTKLTASDSSANGFLGTRVAISRDTTEMRAYADLAPDSSSGSANVFVRSFMKRIESQLASYPTKSWRKT